MASIIQIKRGTGSAVPSGLADGELAINLDNGKLFFGSGSTSVNSFTFKNLTAENYIVSTSVTNITTQTLSGSTQFGDSADDTHQFTGEVTASSNISASGNLISNNLEVNGNITSSGIIMGDTNLLSLGDPDANVGGVRAEINQNGTTSLLGNATLNLKGTTINIDSDSGGTAKISLLGNVTASGNISSSGTITGQAGFTQHSITGTTDGEAKGDVVYFGGTTSMNTGAIYHYKSDGTWELADADDNTKSDGLLGVALGAASDTNGVLLRGMVTLDHDPGAVGDPIYLTTTAGDASATAPSGNGNIVRIIGYCLDASNGQIWFNPDSTFVEVNA